MDSARGNICILFLLLVHWKCGDAQSFSYYFRPGPGSNGEFNIGNPQPFTGFPQRPPKPPFNGSPPAGVQYYHYDLPGGSEEQQQQQRVVHQPIQYYQPHEQNQQRHIQPQYIQQNPQQIQFLRNEPSQQSGSAQHSPQVVHRFPSTSGATPQTFIQSNFNRGQPTYSPATLNVIANTNRAAALNNPKGSGEIKDSLDKIVLNSTTTTAITKLVLTDEGKSEEDSSEEEVTVTPLRISSTAAAFTTTSTTNPSTTSVSPSTTTASGRVRGVAITHYVNKSPTSDVERPTQFPPPEGSPFLPNQFSPQTQQFLPSQFAVRDPPFEQNKFPLQAPPFAQNPYQNQFGSQFPQTAQYEPNHFQGPTTDQFFQNQFPSADPPRGVQVIANHRPVQDAFQGFPGTIPNIDDNSSAEIEEQSVVSTTTPPVSTSSERSTTSRNADGRSNYYKFARPTGLYNERAPLQQYSLTGNNAGEATEEAKEAAPINNSPVNPRKGRKRVRVNRPRVRDESQDQRIPNSPAPFAGQPPIIGVTLSPEPDITTYRSKFRFNPKATASTVRPLVESHDSPSSNDNNDANNTGDAKAAIDRRLQTLQRQIRFKTKNNQQEKRTG